MFIKYVSDFTVYPKYLDTYLLTIIYKGMDTLSGSRGDNLELFYLPKGKSGIPQPMSFGEWIHTQLKFCFFLKMSLL